MISSIYRYITRSGMPFSFIGNFICMKTSNIYAPEYKNIDCSRIKTTRLMFF